MNAGEQPWRLIQEPLPTALLRGANGLKPLQVQILSNRLLSHDDPAISAQSRDLDVLRRWLAPGRDCIADPLALPDMALATRHIHQAIADGATIGIVGDCDVDGITATAIMTEALGHLGARLSPPIIMPRNEVGRGLTMPVVAKLIDAGVHLCITVDNGATSHAEVAHLLAKGIAVIVTDHHHMTTPLAATAVVNPNRADARYPNHALSGAGVALQLARALLGDDDLTDERVLGLIDLAGMGTLADVVPLGLENRALVLHGLQRLNTQPRPGVQALLARMGRALPVTARDITFGIAPRLNAVGRMGADPTTALRLLLARDIREATMWAQDLEAINSARQQQTEAMMALATTLAQPQLASNDPLFISHPDWPLGIIGLIAGRLAERYDRLAVVIATDGAACRGSLRGPAWFHVAAALESFTPPLAQAGGHAQAGGFTTTTSQLNALQAHLAAAYQRAALARPAASHAGDMLPVDAVIPLAHITWERVKQVRALDPFGAGFAEPCFVSPQVRVTQTRRLSAGLHAKVTVTAGGQRRAFFWRRGGATLASIDTQQPVDIAWQMPAHQEMNGEPEPYIVNIWPHHGAVVSEEL